MTTPLLISVVDDDEGIRSALDRLIRSAGYAVATFSSAEAFLQSSSCKQAACLITDIDMPGMDGLALKREICGWERPVPVILISAFLEGYLYEDACASGACCVLKKPFDGTTLLTCIERAIGS